MKIPAKDLKVERFRATGNGGQNVNRRETAIRLSHLPTGITASSQDERSQGQNYKKAMAELIRRIEEQDAATKKAAVDSFRNAQLTSGRVRTYDFSTNTVTDHRTGKKTRLIKDVLNGNLDLVR